MAQYRISGVWKDASGVITHYAVHTVVSNGVARAAKLSKAGAITIVEDEENTVVTWEWNYSISNWVDGQTVHIVHGQGGKYLRSSPDNSKTDNLAHLINFDWITL